MPAFPTPGALPETTADLVVIGGGLGGVAAALTAARLGQRVILTEADPWLGGQLTVQGVPPDESRWVDSHRTSASYTEFRERVREHYKRVFPLTDTAAEDPQLNPGAGFVSRLCHEPRVGALVLEEMLSPLLSSGQITWLREHEPIAVERTGDRVTAVVVRDIVDGAECRLRAPLFADATELGDLLELGGVEHVIGAEARSEHGELHAPDVANPLDQQSITWCCALGWEPGHDQLVPRPELYEKFATEVADFWPGPQLSFDDVHPITLEPRTRPIFDGDPADHGRLEGVPDMWHYRRVRAQRQMLPGTPGDDIALVNWPQIDYWGAPLLGVDTVQRARAEDEARQLTLSFVHWLQHEAPRSDGGNGYPELRLRGDVLGTGDGLARQPYIRESRRIRAQFTVTEAHIGREMRGTHAGSQIFEDSVGIGHYRIDLHPSTAGRTYVDIDCFPFQIPLGALVPRDVANLVPANKNIGTTHISNGAYRLHPVEWAIGEAVGALAQVGRERGVDPAEVHGSRSLTAEVQDVLRDRLGAVLEWPDEIRRLEDRA
ncbi:FAD-dependent oxidoreductase [Brachybacterium alimentarium]|uniref:FAD-dependent oxidoreductase n=1 Tax=Brachybacterium alimentarium TaxID=47845 RepID=UPI000BB96C9F|nr:FAD-dependent oxidoreductase [Brachybacterium alimentarium]PCC30863.1 FAD-dependent oxidoreductase [Brachybacterium alimentarium]